MKVIGFAQLRNELSNNNLQGWFEDMERVCDKIYIYDQASDDGSLEFYEGFGDKVSVIRSTTNNFQNELLCKRVLLQKALLENPECDWIFWMDGDTRLDGRLMERDGLADDNNIRLILKEGKAHNIDGFSLGHLNMWRSNCHYRLITTITTSTVGVGFRSGETMVDLNFQAIPDYIITKNLLV